MDYGSIIPNFKNFLSLHIFVQSLAEQKHALKIPEHTLITGFVAVFEILENL
jgi:hypothetical protein